MDTSNLKKLNPQSVPGPPHLTANVLGDPILTTLGSEMLAIARGHLEKPPKIMKFVTMKIPIIQRL